MKTKIMLISLLAAVCVFVFSGATWAGDNKDRRPKNPKQKHYNVTKHHKPVAHQNHWKKANQNHDEKHQYRHRAPYRGRYQRHVIHHRNYRHKPYNRHHHQPKPYFKHHPYTHRPVKKHQRYLHRRPIYSHTDGNVSILASTSHHGWSINISSKD